MIRLADTNLNDDVAVRFRFARFDLEQIERPSESRTVISSHQ